MSVTHKQLNVKQRPVTIRLQTNEDSAGSFYGLGNVDNDNDEGE